MSGSDFNQKPTKGKLVRLNISKVTFTKGGDAYINYQGTNYITDNNAKKIPSFAFCNCRLKEVIMKQTSIIGKAAFENAQSLTKVVLPDNAEIQQRAFNKCTQLEEVVFPVYTENIYSNAFCANAKLKKLVINNVNYISANGFLRDLPALENVTIKGYLIHIDGWNTIENCASLKSVDFIGPVISTGGPYFATNCPQLSSITFHAPVSDFGFGEEKGCPAFKGYTMKNLVFSSNDPKWAKTLPTEELVKDQRYIPALKQFIATLDDVKKLTSEASLFGIDGVSDVLYNEAKRQLEAGKPSDAYTFLNKAVNYGYMNWKQVKKDSIIWEKAKADSKIPAQLLTIRSRGDYPYCLQQAASYKKDSRSLPVFTYALPSDTLLTKIRNYFNLDSIAGNGDEISRIKNLMYWVHNHIRHNGSSSWPQCRYNAIDLYKETLKEKRGLNCRFMAMVLNDFYLAMGYPSRFITCLPRAFNTDSDCHVTNMAWSRTLNKWIWIDPTFAAYVSDENGNLLNQGEVRERIRRNQPLVLNEDANWNHKQKETKAEYLDYYMAKNLYWLETHVDNIPESESYDGNDGKIIALVPAGFQCNNSKENTTSDATYFWQAPETGKRQ